MDEQRPVGEERTGAGRPVKQVRGDEPGRSYFTALRKWPEEAGITRAELAKRTGAKPTTISTLLNNSGPKPTSPTALEWATKIIKACGGSKQDLANWMIFHTEVLKYQADAAEQVPPLPQPGKEYQAHVTHPPVPPESDRRHPRTARFRTRVGRTVAKVVSLVVVPLLAGGALAHSRNSGTGIRSTDQHIRILDVQHTFKTGLDRITITIRNTRAEHVLVKQIDLYMDDHTGGNPWADPDQWHFTVSEQMYAAPVADYDGSRRTHGKISMSGSEFNLPLVGQGYINGKGGWRRLLTFYPQKFLEDRETVSIVIDVPATQLLQKTSPSQPAGPMVEHEFNPERASLLTYAELTTPDDSTFFCNYLRRKEDQPKCDSVDPDAAVKLPR